MEKPGLGMESKFFIPLILIILLSGGGCGTTTADRMLKPDIMSEMDFSNAVNIDLPLAISLTALEETLNKELDGTFYEGSIDGGIILQLEKAEQLELSAREGGIECTIAVRIRAKKSLWLTRVKGYGVLRLSTFTSLGIAGDWNIETHTEIQQSEWLEKPRIKIGPLGAPVQSLVDRSLEKSRSHLGGVIDESIRQEMPLRENMEALWKQLQAPVEVEASRNVWFHFHPEKVSALPLQYHHQSIHLLFRLWARPEIVVNRPSGSYSESSFALPPLEWDNFPKTPTSRKIRFPFYLSLAAAESLARAELTGQTFEQESYRFTVEDLRLGASGEKMKVEVQLSGSFNGALLMEGLPAYDRSNRMIGVDDLRLKIQRAPFFKKVLLGLFKKRIRKKVEEAMELPMAGYFKMIEAKLKESLENVDFHSELALGEELEGFDLDEFAFSSQGFRIVLASAGQIKVGLKD
jgi:hypothetical protein